MGQYGVLVVDDSAFMRKVISAMIELHPDFYVVGKARNGRDAIEKVERLKPAIVTLDLDMPVLNGIEALKILMLKTELPVVVISNEVIATAEALSLGASDFIIKQELVNDADSTYIESFHRSLFNAISTKLQVKVFVEQPILYEEQVDHYTKANKDLLIIGSSTGGPAALQKIVTRFPHTLPLPVLIIQHMPPGFTKPLADRFNALCNVEVKEAEHNEVLKCGVIYIAPAGIQTMLEKTSDGHFVVKQTTTSTVETLYKPSIDVALLSISSDVREDLLTVILTGMGDDGLKGCKAVKKFGGTIIAEAEETCVVYGMPKVVFDAGLVDFQLPITHIYDEIMRAL